MNSKELLIKKMNDKTARIAILGLGYVACRWQWYLRRRVHGHRDRPGRAQVRFCEKRCQLYPGYFDGTAGPAGQIRATDRQRRFLTVEGYGRGQHLCTDAAAQDGDPDMSFILSATEQLAKYMHKGMIVVLESSTTGHHARNPAADAGGSQWPDLGEDWFLAFSPERVDPGRRISTTLNTPKVVGGITPACAEIAAAWYGGAIQHIHLVSSAEAAEMAKLLENTFRMVNIGMVNELAIMCERWVWMSGK